MDSKKLRILGVDFGHKRLGIALSDESRTIASPLPAIKRGAEAMNQLQAIIDEQEVGEIALGLPLKLDGSEGIESEHARAFGAKLADRFKLQIKYVDERFTTREAERKLIAGKVRRDKRKNLIDSIAASIMLQTLLDMEEIK